MATFPSLQDPVASKRAQPLLPSLVVAVRRQGRALAERPYRLALVAMAAAVLMIAWRARAPWLVLAGLALTDLILAVWVWRAGRPWRMVGPLLVYDLARLARRGRTTLLRSLYASLVLAWLCALALARFPDVPLSAFFTESPVLPLDEWAEFARKFVVSLLALQAAAVMVFTPPYLGGALTEEKERHTLDLLFTTDLHDRELVLGKLLGRMLHIAIVLLGALPIFALARLWGGIDDDLMVAGLAVAVMSLLSTGAISMLCSVMCRTVLQAVVASYLVVFALNVCCLVLPVMSPVLFVFAWDAQVAAEWKEWLDQFNYVGGTPAAAVFPPPNPTATLVWMLVPFVLLQGLIFLGCTLGAIRALRPCCLAPGEVVMPGVLPKDRLVLSSGPLALPSNESRWQPRLAAYSPQPVTEPALLWKEMIHGGPTAPGPGLVESLRLGRRPIEAGLWLLAAGSLCLYLLWPEQWTYALGMLNLVLRVAVVALLGGWCLFLSFRAAGCVSRERDQRTLESLLTLPCRRQEILNAKWLGSVFRYRHLGYVLAGLVAGGTAAGVFHPIAAILMTVTACVHLPFLTSMGVWLSLASRNTLRANLTMAGVLCFWFGGFLAMASLKEFLILLKPGSWLDHFLDTFLCPASTWWYMAFTWQEIVRATASGSPAFWGRLCGTLVSLPVFGGSAWLLWRLSRREFRRGQSWRRA